MRILSTLFLGLYLLATPFFNPSARAQKRKKQPLPVYQPGYYWLADGSRHEGQLCLVSDNELLVKGADTARAKQCAAVHVRNFVIAADSFTVLRDISVNVNNIITRYPSAMVQVIRPVQGMPLYRLRGPMQVLPLAPDKATMMVLRGISGGAVGIAGGMLADGMREGSPPAFKEQVLTLWVVRATPTGPLETLQPQTMAARTRLLALMAGNKQVTSQLQSMPAYSLTEGAILQLFGLYFSAPPASR